MNLIKISGNLFMKMKKGSELKTGIKMESEHKDTYEFLDNYIKKNGKLPPEKEFYARIAKNHIEGSAEEKGIKDYYTRLQAMEQEAEMQKARVTKYIKRVPKPSGKGYYYFYNQAQWNQYKKTGEVPKQDKKGFLSGIMAFFGFGNEKEAAEKVKSDYQSAGIKEKFKTSLSDWSKHITEYFLNKEKWDALFLKKLEAQNKVKDSGPAIKKAAMEAERKAASEISKEVKKNIFNLTLMYFIYNYYNREGQKNETTTYTNTGDDTGTGSGELSADNQKVHSGSTQTDSLSNVPESKPSDNPSVDVLASRVSGERSGRDVRLTKGQIKATRQQIKDLLASKTDEEMTEADKDLLRQYEGAGGLKEEGASANAVLYEYYTPRTVVSKMWQLVNKYTGTGQKLDVLEPSAGIGRFAENQPHDFTMIEYEEDSYRINKILNPGADVRKGAFQQLFMKGNVSKKEYAGQLYDVVIGNPPYGEYSGFEKGLGEGKDHTSYPEYFMDRGLQTLKDGGIMAFIVPSDFLRGNNYSAAKSAIARQGKILEAYRLPSGTFGTTGIGTDIIILRKEPGQINDFLDDKYFKDNPEKVLGDVEIKKDQWGKFKQHVTLRAGETFDGVMANLDVNAVPIVGIGQPAVKKQVSAKVNIAIPAKSANPKKQKKSANNFETMPDKETDSAESFNKKYNQKYDKEQLNIWKATTYTGAIDRSKLSQKENKLIESSDDFCIQNGEYVHRTNYASGDIYKKLEELENQKDSMPEAKYEKQKKILEDAAPVYKTVKNFSISPISEFAKHFVFEGEEGEKSGGFIEKFFKWAVGNSYSIRNMDWSGGVTQHDIPAGLSWTDIVDYIKQISARSEKGADPLIVAKTKELRREVAEKLVKRFMEFGLNPDEQRQLEERYNKQFNSYVAPDYLNIPLFLDGISTSFKGDPLTVKSKQMNGISFLANKGNGLLAHDVGGGKGHLLTSDILTPDGWVKMGDIKIGSIVVGKNGRPTEVTGVYPLGKVQCYRVTLSDGTFTDVSAEHLWSVQTLNYRSKYPKKWDVVLTKDIKDKLYNYRQDCQYSIPMVEPVQFKKRELKIDPYVLGALLGDGGISQKHTIISSADAFIIEEVRKKLADGLNIKKRTNSKYDYSISAASIRNKIGQFINGNPLSKALKEYNLQGTKSNSKFIPDDYKYSCVEDRIALLQGLFDTDGYIGHNGVVTRISSSSLKLARDITEIIQSLGGTVRLTFKHPFYTYKGEKKQGQPAYVLTVRVPANIKLFRLPRKADNVKPKTKYIPVRFIESIEDIGFHEAQCIKVDAKDSLYVCDNYIVTHNTMSGIIATVNQLQSGRAKKPVICVPKAVYKNWLAEIRDLFPTLEINQLGNLTKDFVKSDLNIKEGTLSIMTYEGLEQITFKPETVNGELLDDMLDAQQYEKGKNTDRDKSEVRQKLLERLGVAISSKNEVVEGSGATDVKLKSKEGFKKGGRSGESSPIEPSSIKSAFSLYGSKFLVIKNSFGWNVTEVKSGLQAGSGGTRDAALQTAINNLTRKGEDGFKEMMSGSPVVNADAENNFETMPEEKAKVSTAFYFENLGFDHITIDEMHNFKNVFGEVKATKRYETPRGYNQTEKEVTNANEFSGLKGGTPSKQAQKMFALTQLIQRNNDDRNVFGLTATPFTNSPIEIYNMLSLIARKKLKNLGIYNLHEFMAHFAKLRTELSVKLDGKIEQKTVMKEFQNLSALQSLIKEYMDKVSSKDFGVKVPDVTRHQVELNMTATQKAIYAVEMKRFENTKDKGAMLKAINNMRMCTVSPELVHFDDMYAGTGIPKIVAGEDFIDDSPKMKFTFDSIAKFHAEKPNIGQVVYLPRGIEKIDKAIANLVKQGVPKDSIAVLVGSGKYAKSDDQKAAVMKEFNDPDGKIKVIIGSETIQEGVNLNGNSAVLYNTMLGWNPAETVQVEGRILRQGNMQDMVNIVYPQLIDSVDSGMYQKHDEKMSRFNALWDFDGDSIDVSDINPEELKFDLIKDPVRRAGFIMDLALQKLDSKKRDSRIFIDTLNKFKNDYADKTASIERDKKRLPEYEKDVAEAETGLKAVEDELKDFKSRTSKKEPGYENELARYERTLRNVKERVQSEKKYLKEAQKEIAFAEKDIKWITEKLNNMGVAMTGIDNRILEENKKVENLHKEEVDIKENKDKFIAQAKKDIEAAKKTAPSVSAVINDHVKLVLGNLKLSADALKEMAKAMKHVFIKFYNPSIGKTQYKKV